MVPVAGYFLLASRMSPYLVDRYIMPLFPFVALLLALLLCLLGKKLTEISGWKEQIVGGMLVLLLVVVQGLRPMMGNTSIRICQTGSIGGRI